MLTDAAEPFIYRVLLFQLHSRFNSRESFCTTHGIALGKRLISDLFICTKAKLDYAPRNIIYFFFFSSSLSSVAPSPHMHFSSPVCKPLAFGHTDHVRLGKPNELVENKIT